MLAETGAFLAGARPTLADIAAYEELGQNQPKYANVQEYSRHPNIRRWLAAMEELWQRVVLLEEQGETMAAAELQAEKLVEIKEEYDAAARLRDMMP